MVPDPGPDEPRHFYTFEHGGVRYAIFLGKLVGKPNEFDPEKWYAWRFPRVWDTEPGEAFETAEAAEDAIPDPASLVVQFLS